MLYTAVYLDDSSIGYDRAPEYFAQADRWAQQHCRSYSGYGVEDVSDFSYNHDLIAEYRFADEQDIVVFSLRWK